MEQFTNDIIDLTTLPRYEEVMLTPINIKFFKVLLIKWLGVNLFLSGGYVLALSYIDEFKGFPVIFILLFLVVSIVFLGLLFVAVKKRKYAFRTHDVIYQYGLIATVTKIIPYNRIQHVALVEGVLSRWFGLASLEIYTAGDYVGDLTIHGLDVSMAKELQQLLLGKIDISLE